MKTPFGILPLAALFIHLSLSLGAAPRAWKNADGSKSIQAEFLSRDDTSVTLRRSDGRVLTFSLDKLHASEQSFLEENHPFVSPEDEEEPDGDAFGSLKFGDSRNEVEEKLLKSSIVSTKTDRTFFGRTGLNGIFQTTQSIGGLHCFLYFDWNDSGNLREVTLRTDKLASTEYESKLRNTWTALIELLSKLYGKPISTSTLPKQSELQDGLMLASHLWRTSDGYSVLLGPGQQQADYNISVRFTTKRIEPVVVP